jgi:hypothetical protein
MSSEDESARQDDRILLPTRILAAVILPFLVIAALILLLFPDRTGELFAWAITPPMSASLLASAYIGGVWYFICVLRASAWHRVQHGFPAVAVFASALLIATLLHLDRFSANLSFWVWLALYATTPFLVVAAAIAQRRRARRIPETGDVVVPPAIADGLAGVGAVAFAFGALLFCAPELAVTSWAWQLTPLTAQVTGAVLALTGVVNAALLRDRRWSAFQAVFEAQLVSLAAIGATVVLHRDDLLWERPTTLVFVLLVAGAIVGYGGFFLWASRTWRAARRGAHPGSAA